MDRAGRFALTAATVATAIALVGCLPAGTRGTGGRGTDSGGPGGSSPPSLAAPSGAAGSPSFVPPTPTPAPTFAVYTVKRGDSLNSIAKAYGTTARSVAYWNRTTFPSLDPDSPGYAPGRLQVGWNLVLIPGLVYDEETGAPVLPSGAVPAP